MLNCGYYDFVFTLIESVSAETAVKLSVLLMNSGTEVASTSSCCFWRFFLPLDFLVIGCTLPNN